MKRDEIKKQLKSDKFEELDNYFEISLIKDESFLLRQVRRKIIEKFEHAIAIIDGFLHPETTLLDASDAESFSAADREKAVGILKALALVIKEHQLLEMESKDDEERKFLKEALIVYKRHLADIKFFISKTKDKLIQAEEKAENINYLG